MIKTVRNLTDNELNLQCEKYDICVEDLRRADKIRALASKNIHNVYLTGEEKSLKSNQVSVESQTIVRQKEDVPFDTISFANVAEPTTSIELCDSLKQEKKVLTNNVVVTDAVYSHLAVQEDLHINGSIISRGIVLNPEPVCIKIKQNNPIVNLDLKSDFYTLETDSTESIVNEFTLNIKSDDLAALHIGHKGTIVIKGSQYTKVTMNNDNVGDANFISPSLLTIGSSGRFSFAFYVIKLKQDESKKIQIRFIEEPYEASNSIFSTWSLSSLNDDVPPNTTNGNSYLVSNKKDDDSDPKITWQSVTYVYWSGKEWNVDSSLSTSNPNINFNASYANYDIIVSGTYNLFNFDAVPDPIGTSGYIKITNVADGNAQLSIGDYSHWKFPESLPNLTSEQSIVIEYVVIKTDLIVGKIVHLDIYNTIYNIPSESDEIIVHVTVNSEGSFEFKVNSNETLETLDRGATYLFVYQDNSFNQHPLLFSNVKNGYWS